MIFDTTMFGHDLIKSLGPVLQATLQTAGDELMAEIGSEDPWKMPPPKAKEFIAGRENKIKNMGDTAFKQLQTSLSEGLDKGESTEDLAGRIRSVFNNLSKGEARRIAMTETSAAYGFARHQAMSDAGIEAKAWLSSHGPNRREAHIEAEDKYGSDGDPGPVAMDEPFIVNGEELMYPGDPAGSPENVINCHCIQIAAQKP
jgi:hypothetical protein